MVQSLLMFALCFTQGLLRLKVYSVVLLPTVLLRSSTRLWVEVYRKANDQEIILSNSTSHPKQQTGKKDTYKLINFTRDKHSNAYEQLLPKQVVCYPN